jgi:hypothetical protein
VRITTLTTMVALGVFSIAGAALAASAGTATVVGTGLATSGTRLIDGFRWVDVSQLDSVIERGVPTRVWLGTYGGGIPSPTGGVIPNMNGGLQWLLSQAEIYGGKVLSEYVKNPNSVDDFKPFIDEASEIVFYVAEMRPGGWTEQELEYILSDRSLTARTIFVFNSGFGDR